MRIFKKQNIVFFAFFPLFSISQSKLDLFLKPSDTLNVHRKNTVLISEAVIGVATISALSQLWYAEHDQYKFHTTKDGNQWLQMDKLGHAYSSYQITKYGAQLLHWSGAKEQNRWIYGSVLSFTFLTAIEVLDGFSSAWGFSWGDIAANSFGTGIYVGQELLWHEQRAVLKYSFMQTHYAKQNPDKLGENYLQQLLKDYNGQTYWLSFSLHAFLRQQNIPKWLNLAIGYGGESMLFGKKSRDGVLGNANRHFRQYYLGLDLNLRAIKTNSRFLRSFFEIVDMIKFPLPCLKYENKSVVFQVFNK